VDVRRARPADTCVQSPRRRWRSAHQSQIPRNMPFVIFSPRCDRAARIIKIQGRRSWDANTEGTCTLFRQNVLQRPDRTRASPGNTQVTRRIKAGPTPNVHARASQRKPLTCSRRDAKWDFCFSDGCRKENRRCATIQDFLLEIFGPFGMRLLAFSSFGN